VTRGKHKARAQGRRRDAAEERIANLRQQIAEEAAALKQAQAVLDQVAAARVTLREDGQALMAATRGHARHAEDEHEWLASVVREARRLTSDLQPGWEAYMGRCQDVSAGASPKERLETLMGVLIGGGVLSDSPAAARLDTQCLTRLERARGERRQALDGEVYPPRWWWALMVGLVRPVVVAQAEAAGLVGPDRKYQPPQTPKAQAALDLLRREVTAVLASRSEHLNSAAVLYAWAPSPALPHTVPASVPVLGALGADVDEHSAAAAAPGDGSHSGHGPDTGDLASLPWPRPTPTMPAVIREQLGTRSPADLLSSWGDRLASHQVVGRDLGAHGTLLGTAPRHPRPGRAAVLRSLYAASATSSWLHAQDVGSAPESIDAAAPGHRWGGARQRASFGRAAVGLAAAAPFWLPAGQTHAFASSEALDDDARAEIALPYPQVLLAFAEPLVLAPVREPTPAEAAAFSTWSTQLSGQLASPDATLDQLAPRDFGPLDAGAVMEFAGCTIEAVLLFADSLGAPADEFAWCVALPGRHGRAVLGRFVIPARHDRTRYRALLDNLMAVAAWADWHEPDTAATPALDAPGVPPPQVRRDADRHGADVHVLNVGRTVGHAHSAEPTGKTVAPHVRAGTGGASATGSATPRSGGSESRRCWSTRTWATWPNGYTGCPARRAHSATPRRR
jgi:hypothetical protein